MPILTTAVTVQFQLHSSASPAPYNMTDCAGTIYYNDNNQLDFDGWVAEDIGTPEPNGATFTLQVDDLDYVAAGNVTGVANWAVTFIPRGTTTAQSPLAIT